MTHQLKYSFLFLFLSLCATIFAQEEIVIAGQVTDKTDLLPIANAKVSFIGAEGVTSTDTAGFFALRTFARPKALEISILGYKTKIKKLRKGKSMGVQIKLEENSSLLQEVFVYSQSQSALNLIDRVRDKRELNNPAKKSPSTVFVRKNTQASICELSRGVLNNRLFRSLQKNTIQSQDSTWLLPLLQNSEYFRLDSTRKIVLLSSRKDILPRHKELVNELVHKLPDHVNFYENYVTVFGKNFLSPIAQTSDASYNYQIKDSIKTTSGTQYKVLFSPKNNKDLLFEGTMFIDSATYALTKIEASMPGGANVNFLRRLAFRQSFISTANVSSFDSLHFVAGFQIISQKDNKTKNSLFIVQDNIYSDIIATIDHQPIMQPNPHFDAIIDSVGNTKVMRRTAWLADLVMNRYMHIGKFDFGPVTQTLSYNDLEGNKISIGGRTGKKLWENFTLGGYASYGLGDEKWKFGGEMQYRFKQTDYQLLGLKYRDDVYQLDYDYHDEIANENTLGNGVSELLSFILQSFPEKCSRRQIVDIFYDKEWKEGVSTHFSVQQTNYLPNAVVPFQTSLQSYRDFQDYRLTLSLRLSKNQRILDEYFHRMYIKNKYPLLFIVAEGGMYRLNNRQDSYIKLHFLETQTFQLGNIGKFAYSVDGGYLFGNVPFSLLEIYSGVKNYGLDKMNVTLISLDLFAADKYVNFDSRLVTYGVIFNKIPLIRKLNLREMVCAKLACGGLSGNHSEVMSLPGYLKPMEAPYLVVGAGIANILKIASVEYVMEMPQITNPKTYWGLRFKLYVDL